MENFFTNAFENMNSVQKESFIKSVFMNDNSEYAKELRKKYYKNALKSMGENVEIGINVKIENPQFIKLGNNVKICDGVTLIARGEGGIEIGDNVRINDRVYLDTEAPDKGYIKIGNNVYIGTGTTLFGHNGFEIKDYALLAQNITSTPYSHIYSDPNKTIISQGGHTRKITIGKDSYVGMGVCIMYSADIGDGSVVGSGSVVVKSIPPYTVAVGNPAKVIKERKL